MESLSFFLGGGVPMVWKPQNYLNWMDVSRIQVLGLPHIRAENFDYLLQTNLALPWQKV
jgi:hypothetical protein